MFKVVPAGARAAAGDGVGGLDDNRFDRLIRIFAMMSLHGFDNLFGDVELLEDAAADFDMRTRNFVVQGLADVVEERSGLGHGHVGTQFLGNHASHVGHLDGMLQHILTVTGAKMESAENSEQFGVEIVDFAFHGGRFTLFLDDFIDLRFGLGHKLLDFGRLNATVGNQTIERELGHRAADWVERGEGNGVGRVIDYYLDSGGPLERFDVAAFFADDFAFQFVGG